MSGLYPAAICVTIMFLLITAIDVMTNQLITRKRKARTGVACLTIAVAALCECAGVYLNGAAVGLIPLHRLAKVAEFCFAPAIGVAAAIAYGDTRRPGLAILLTVVHAAFECVAVPFGWVFSVDAANQYHRETWYLVYVAAFILATAYCFVCILRNGRTYQAKADGVLVLNLSMLVVGIGIQFVYSSIKIDYLCIAIGNLLFSLRACKLILQVDAVTRLLNRRCYDVSISDLDAPATLIYFDVNRFKQVNDTYGHAAGDRCLRTVASLIRGVYRKKCRCYRIGGDELCVILHGGAQQAEALNARFAAALEAQRAKDPQLPGVSVGYATLDGSAHILKVIEEADAMLYRNKRMMPREA